MNKKLLLCAALLGMSLASCTDVEQLYDRGAYLTGTFTEHVYNVYEGATKQGLSKIVHSVILENEEHGYFAGSGAHDKVSNCQGYGQAKQWHPDYFKRPDGGTYYWGYDDRDEYGHAIGVSDIVPGKPGELADNSPLYDIVYSQNKRLDRYYPKFARGYLSKLYNGQIKCNGWSYYAMVVVSDEGFGTMFPYELSKAEYFATSILAGTDYEAGGGRIVVGDVTYTFFKYGASGDLEGYQVTCKDIYLTCNAGAARTSLVGFTFADAGFSPSSIVGMAVSWNLVHDDVPASGHFEDEGNHDGLALYEVFFPNSMWY